MFTRAVRHAVTGGYNAIGHSWRRSMSVATADIFLAHHHLEALEASLTCGAEAAEKLVVGSLTEAAPGGRNQSAEQWQQEWRRVERRIRESPIHIGFLPSDDLFAGGQFLAGLDYESRHVRAQRNGCETRISSPTEDRRLPQEQRPVYGAVNLSLRGHAGWGRSHIVLKPDLQDRIELHSRDSGEEYSRYYGKTASFKYLYPLVEDWVRIRQIEPIWQALAGPNRLPINRRDIWASTPLEAAIYAESGRITPEDMAMIIVNNDDFQQRERFSKISTNEKMNALTAFSDKTGVPVVAYSDSPQGTVYQDLPGYDIVMKNYSSHCAKLYNYE